MFILNHANFVVPDVDAAAAFFVDHFGFSLSDMRGNGGFAVLDGAGFHLNLMRARHPDDAVYPENFHIGFLVPDPALVRAKQASLAAASLEPGPAETISRGGRRSLTFYCRAPGGILVEVTGPAE